MELFYLLGGVALLAIVLVDLWWTTLWPDGAGGPLSNSWSRLIWAVIHRLDRARPGVATLAGPAVLAASLLLWIGLLWVGWTLLFASDATSLVDTADGNVTWSDRVYFVGYSVFTLGNGELSPAEGVWQIATTLMTATGMVIITLGVTYLLSVISAVAQTRAFAATVSGLGEHPEEILLTAWNGRDLHALDLVLNTFSSDLSIMADRHKAFPVLHYFRPSSRKNAAAVSVATLDEALTLMEAGVREESWNPVTFRAARSGVSGLLAAVNDAQFSTREHPPEPPNLKRLRDAGIPTVDERSFLERVDRLADRRQALHGMVRADGWDWPA